MGKALLDFGVIREQSRDLHIFGSATSVLLRREALLTTQERTTQVRVAALLRTQLGPNMFSALVRLSSTGCRTPTPSSRQADERRWSCDQPDSSSTVMVAAWA